MNWTTNSRHRLFQKANVEFCVQIKANRFLCAKKAEIVKAGVRKDYDLEQDRAGSSVTVNSLIVSEEFLESELAAYKRENQS